MNLQEFVQLPNLLSLSRIPLAALAMYFLAQSDAYSAITAVTVLTVAGITDGLDGYLARRRGQVTPLGVALDPIADKLFAIILVAGLIMYRDFPVWMAAAIVGRDLLILGGGLLISRNRAISLPSNLTGKYAFAATVVLLVSYVIRYEFGIQIMTVFTVVLLAASLVSYTRVFVLVRRGGAVSGFEDTAITRNLRRGATWLVSAVYVVKLYLDLLR